MEEHQPDRAPIEIGLAPNAMVVEYIRKKCWLPADQIEKKLLNGETFDIRGEGTDLDTKLIDEMLKENDFYEKPSQKMMKEEAMKFVKGTIAEWSMELARTEMRITPDEVQKYTAKVLAFGSYVLDLKSNSSDIDLICVCPNFIKRETHFFGSLAKRIEQDPEVKNFSSRINAKVPILTFNFKEIDIDISFCQLDKEIVPENIEKTIPSDLIDSTTDEKSKTSLLGRKNNLMILDLAGKQIENFKQTLRAVKVWAKNRGISSNAMGYLGGISWAILVAKICQIFPNHKPNKLFAEFFMIYSLWSWKTTPVHLLPAPVGEFEKYLMCIVTPGSFYNSTERVNDITFKVLCSEIKRANEIMMSKKDIQEVCRKDDFFGRFPLFMEIDVCGVLVGKDDERDYKDFQGSVESRILKLLQNIVRYHKKVIEDGTLRINVNPKLFRKQDPNYPLCSSIFMGIMLSPGAEVNMLRAVKEWCTTIGPSRGANKNLNMRVFEVTKDELTDIELNEPKKKVKEDPRLAMRPILKSSTV